MASVLGALPLTFLALFYVAPRIDPKGAAYAKFGGFYQGFVISFTVFMCAISWLGELTVWNLLPGKGARSTSSCPGRSARSSSAWVIIYLVCGKNYTLGIKTPWALDDPDNWRRTHRFGGACFMVVGVSLIVLGFLGGILPEPWLLAVIMVLAIGSVAAMYVYRISSGANPTTADWVAPPVFFSETTRGVRPELPDRAGRVDAING